MPPLTPADELPEGQDPHRWHSLRPWTRHSLVLAVSGICYMFVGVSYIFSEANPAREAALSVAIRWMPLSNWGWGFVLVGLAAIMSSRWPPASETWGYTAMTGQACAWSGFYFAGVILGSAPQNLSGGVTWAMLAFMWWAVSGLRNPSSTSFASRVPLCDDKPYQPGDPR